MSAHDELEKVREQIAAIENELAMLQSLVVSVAKKAGLSSGDFITAMIEAAVVHDKATQVSDAMGKGSDVPEEIKEKVEEYLNKMRGASDEH
jgi:acid phosphatase family membrane protein YuiD